MRLDDVLRALRDPTRREILRILRNPGYARGEIADHFPLAKSTPSGHFNVLKQAGLVVTERQGTTIVHSLNVSATEEALAAMMELLGVGREGREQRS